MIAGRGPDAAVTVEVRLTSANRPDNEGTGAVDEPNIMAQRLDARPFSTGQKVANHLPDDDQTVNRMVEQGVDDAEEDDMRTARKHRKPTED